MFLSFFSLAKFCRLKPRAENVNRETDPELKIGNVSKDKNKFFGRIYAMTYVRNESFPPVLMSPFTEAAESLFSLCSNAPLQTDIQT